MKLNKNIIKYLNNNIQNKFINCSMKSLHRGDYIQLKFFLYDSLKKGGISSRINKITAILLKKTIRFNTISFLISTMYKNEKVKWRF